MNNNRHFGLDVVRTLAITIVFIGHANPISDFINFSVPDFLKNLAVPDGVDLFFVLSGFLIGRILLNTKPQTFKDLKHFWKRRWLRTLPNYFLFLLVNLFLLWLSISPGLLSHAVLYYFVFLQNLYKPVDVFFWESWSLSVEEWFYLLFPLALFVLCKVRQNFKMVFLLSVILFFSFSVFFKHYFYNPHQPFNFDLYQRILVVNRFDVLSFGLLLAWLENTYPWLLSKLKIPGVLIFLIFLLLVRIDAQLHPVIYFICSGIVCSALLLFCYGFSKSDKFSTVIFENLSKVSYSIYLVHMPVLYCFNYFSDKNYSQFPVIYLAAYTLMVLVLSFLNYRYFESYFLKKRDEWI